MLEQGILALCMLRCESQDIFSMPLHTAVADLRFAGASPRHTVLSVDVGMWIEGSRDRWKEGTIKAAIEREAAARFTRRVGVVAKTFVIFCNARDFNKSVSCSGLILPAVHVYAFETRP